MGEPARTASGTVIPGLDGKFTLTGENGQTLVFSYIGMTLQEIVYKGNPFLLAPKSAPNRHLKLLFLPREIVGLYAAPMPNVL